MLTRCPSCQASVLDDDAEVCPFCGSPMDPAQAKGFQPAAKPAQKSAPPRRKSAPSPEKPSSAKKERPAAKPSGKPATKSSASSNSATATRKSSDDPFAVDPASLSGVIPLAAKPSQKRPKKIVCPMCDTVGYAPVSASGKEVRCANPSCMVPVFTAPDFAAPKREVIETPSSKGTVLTIVGIAIVVFGGGFAYWWLNFRVPQTPDNTPIVADPGTPTTTPVAPTDGEENAPAEDPEPAVPPATAAEVRARAFEHWPNITNTIVDIGRRPERLRDAAESYAITGNLEQARSHLAKIEENDRFYKIGPLAEIAWEELASGKATAAEATFQKLSPLQEAIPTRGFEPARSAILWSAAAARFGDPDAAHEVASSRRDDAGGERLLASLESAATLANFDLDANYTWRPVFPWTAPKRVAVAYSLIRHGQSEAALAWAEGASPDLARAETLAAWAEGKVRESAGVEEIQQAIASLDPAIKLDVLSRAALRAIALDNTAAAEALFADIPSAAKAIAPSEPLTAATAGKLYSINIREAAVERLRGAALAEAAHAAVALKKTELANSFLWSAVDHLRALAPPLGEMEARQQEFDSAGLAGIRRTLKTELSLNDSEAQKAATDYRRDLPTHVAAAEETLELQSTLLARGVQWGLGESILQEIKTREASERYLAGSVGGRIWAAFQQADDSEAAASIRAAGVTNRDVPRAVGMELVVGPLIEEGQFAEAGKQFSARAWNPVSDAARQSLAMRIVTRLAGEGQHAAITQFLQQFRPGADLDELYRLWAARSAATGQGMEFLDQIDQSRVSVTTLASALRGLTAGLQRLPETTAQETAMSP